MTRDDLPELPPGAFAKQDAGSDLDFYADARLVTHIDERAIAALSDCYRRTLPPDGVILDLMSSWVSHLPADVAYEEVIGHGMNEEELEANPRLDRWFVQDLNDDPILNLDDESLDAAMICVAIQYLQRPVEVLSEVARALKPGAPLVISFSNRCFPTKAVAIWRTLDQEGHVQLVNLYLRKAGFSAVEADLLMDGESSDPLIVVTGRR
jgi:hypothetical protein